MDTKIMEAGYITMLSLLVSMVITPVLMRVANRIGWVDKPNSRKVHSKPVPVIGGAVIFVSMMLTLFMTQLLIPMVKEYGIMMGGIMVIFLTGVWDDRMDISPRIRLLIQFACAYGVTASGIRVTSLHGLFGIEDIPLFWQYILTVMVIAGVTNAFNLMDGIDGLAGGLALINMLILALLAYLSGKAELMILLMAASGSLVIFLFNNFHPARMFMGDGGSLMFGFIMSCAGIVLIEGSGGTTRVSKDIVLLLVSVILVVPVFDSLRVYAGRIMRGGSPFRADKTHLHHLFLLLGLNHGRAAIFIYGMELTFIVAGFLLKQVFPFSLALIFIVSVFLLFCQLLEINRNVDKWLQQIRKIEND
jgi:UDP-GlcNAc:undecaprenyl-phosphate GlcNAc-1-phosphate transferase